jgi:hypothetical protein
MLCEQRLIKLCKVENFIEICQVADIYNANRLKEFCSWFQRINPKVNELLNVNASDNTELDMVSNFSFLEYKFLHESKSEDGKREQ